MVKWVRFNVFEEAEGPFEASCQTIKTLKLFNHWFRVNEEVSSDKI